MPQPDRSSVHVNRPLTNILLGYQQKALDFIADRVFPIVPVEKQSDRYFSYEKGNWYRDSAEERADGAESAGGGWEIDNTPTYNCKVQAFHKMVSDRMRQNSDKPINLDRDATNFVGKILMIRRELNFAAKYFGTGIWNGAADFTPGTKWDAANSNPINNIDDQKEIVRQKHGYEPNTLIVTPDVHKVLKNHDEVLDRIKYTQKGSITPELLASILEIDNYLIAKGIQNTAEEKDTDAMSNIFGTKKCLLVYAAPVPSIMEPSGGYTFSWTGLLGSNALAGRMKKFYMKEKEADRVEGEMAYDQKLVAADVGNFFDAVLT